MKKRVAIAKTLASLSQTGYTVATILGIGAIIVAAFTPRRPKNKFLKGERHYL